MFGTNNDEPFDVDTSKLRTIIVILDTVSTLTTAKMKLRHLQRPFQSQHWQFSSDEEGILPLHDILCALSCLPIVSRLVLCESLF